MIATMFCMVPVSASDEPIGNVPENYVPEGTAITTAEEFAAMTADGKYYLANDITISASWNAGEAVAAPKDATAFAGTLDGNGKTITTTAALFANGSGATVKNLTVVGEIAANSNYNSAVVAYAKGAVTLENIYNKATVVNGTSVGALIGYGATGTILTIKNCVNDGNVTGSGQVGGLAGYIQDDVANIENSVNNGVVTSTASYGAGIIGRFGRDAADADSVVTIKNCVNNGAVNTAGAQTGGMLGYALGRITIEDCINNGDITNTQAAGGIFGILGNKAENVYSLLIKNCVNNATVKGTVAVGGIVGRQGRNAGIGTYRVENCVNNGDVYLTSVALPTTADSAAYVGGISGYAWGGANCGIVNCINTGDIFATTVENTTAYRLDVYVCGLVGYVNGTKWVAQNSINAGAITVTGPAPLVTSLTVYNKNVAPEAGTLANNYSVACGEIGAGYIGDPAAAEGSTLVVVDAAAAKAVTAEQMASGEVAFAMNESAGVELFFQNLGALNADAVPTLDNTHKSVIKNENGTFGNPALNLNKINPLLAQADALVEAAYTAETFAAVTAAVAEAKAAIALETPDQAKVDAAAEKLEAALAALIPSTPAAEVGGVNYPTIEAAVAALTDGATLKLLSDLTVSATVVIDKSVTIDGNGKTITSEGVDALKFEGDSLTITVKNLNVVSAKKGIVFAACTSAETKSTVTITDTEIVSNGGDGVEVLAFWAVTLDKVEIDGSSAGFRCNTDNGANTITVTNSKINGRTSYGFYMVQASTGTITDSTITTTAQKSGTSAPNSAIQIKTSTAETGSTLTLNNVTASGAGYTVAVNPFNKIYINGGTYTMISGEGYVNADAVINVGNADAYCKITGGTFTSVKNCAARVYTTTNADKGVDGDNHPSVLDIEGGTFILNNASSSGSALRAGTGSGWGTINISGGHFITNGTGAVVNTANAKGVINITGGIFENNGTNEIKVVDNTGNTAVAVVEFPAGVKAVEFKNGAFVEYVAPSTPDTPDVPGGDTTTVPGGETTTAPNDGDETTVPGGNDETTVGGNEETTTKAPDTTKTPEEPKKKSCGGFALAAQLVTILGAAITVVAVKKK